MPKYSIKYIPGNLKKASHTIGLAVAKGVSYAKKKYDEYPAKAEKRRLSETKRLQQQIRLEQQRTKLAKTREQLNKLRGQSGGGSFGLGGYSGIGGSMFGAPPRSEPTTKPHKRRRKKKRKQYRTRTRTIYVAAPPSYFRRKR